ncbi:hypothetical protein D9M71_548880 [compost metagenome]
MLKLAHDLWQHGVGRGGAQDDGQLFTQVFDQRQQLQARQAHDGAQHDQHEAGTGQVEQRHQPAQVLQRRQAVLAGGEGNGAEHADRRQAHDHAHDAEDHMAQFVDQSRYAGRRVTHKVQRAAEQHREQQHLEDVVVGEGADHRSRDQVHEECRGTVDVLAALGQAAGIGAGQLVQVDVGAAADAAGEGEHQADHQRQGGQHFEVDHRLQADAADLFQVTSARDAADHDAEHDQADEHLDQLDEAVAEGFELQGEVGEAETAGDAEGKAEHDLQEDRTRAPFEHGRDL